MSGIAHLECSRVGKFDCAFDEWVHDVTLDGEPGEGDVESPSAWFASVNLDRSQVSDVQAIEHYGTELLIARELNNGRWFIETYPTVADREQRLTSLREGLEAWDSAEFDA